MTTANDVDSVVWHVRIDHIGQDIMNKLARDSLLAKLLKLPCSLANIIWRESLLENLLEKPH